MRTDTRTWSPEPRQWNDTRGSVLQHEQHSLDGRAVDVKAAMPKSRGGSKEKGLKMFVGGLPVCHCCVSISPNHASLREAPRCAPFVIFHCTAYLCSIRSNVVIPDQVPILPFWL